jgi:hypothetical protein
MLSFFFFSPLPGGFLSTTRFHERKTQNGELLLTRVFAQIAFRKPKNKRGKQSLSTFHPPTLHHNSLINVSTEKSYPFGKISLFEKIFCSSLPPFPRICEPPRAAKEAQSGFFPRITQKGLHV